MPGSGCVYNFGVIEFFKGVAGMIIAGVVVVAGGITWWRMDPATRHALVGGTGHILAWLGLVLLVPWATFFVSGWVAKKFNSNFAGAVLVFTYTALEAVLLAWLFGWSVSGATAWTFFVVGVLFAGVYNLLICDWLAEKME